MAFGGHSALGERIDGVFDDFGVALALLGRFLGVSGFEEGALGVRLIVDFAGGAIGGFSKNIFSRLG
jgi:hypothetical protein